MLLGVAVFFGVIAVLYLGGYLLTTAFLSDRMVWFPLDYRDYTYHGFTSVRDYLNHGNNFWDLLDLHTFSLLISSVIYFAAGGLGYGLKSLTMRGRNA